MNECKEMMSTLVIGSRVKAPCIDGFVLTINAVLRLCERLYAEYGFKFILTNRMNQDALENHFSIIRRRGAFVIIPTPLHSRQRLGKSWSSICWMYPKMLIAKMSLQHFCWVWKTLAIARPSPALQRVHSQCIGVGSINTLWPDKLHWPVRSLFDFIVQ